MDPYSVPRAHPDPAVGPIGHVLHDRVAMPVLVADGDQYVQKRRRQRQEGDDVGVVGHVTNVIITNFVILSKSQNR